MSFQRTYAVDLNGLSHGLPGADRLITPATFTSTGTAPGRRLSPASSRRNSTCRSARPTFWQRNRPHPWSRSVTDSYGDVSPEGFDVYIGLEEAASQLAWYESELGPGLLQTEDYARTLIRADNPGVDEEEIGRRVHV